MRILIHGSVCELYDPGCRHHRAFPTDLTLAEATSPTQHDRISWTLGCAIEELEAFTHVTRSLYIDILRCAGTSFTGANIPCESAPS
jgi:hypothetical protein